jgi:signal recognition particle receptor subunit beta
MTMKEYKLLITGTMGAGKTTAIRAISDIEPIVTDVANHDRSVDKERTTVGLDYGMLNLDNGDRIRLFGTPGQARFDFLWKILARKALGLIILVDNARPEPLADLVMFLEGFASSLDSMPCVIGVGRLDTHPATSLDDYADLLESRGQVFPILAVDVRQRADVVALIDTLLGQIESGMILEAP